jgi:hypothetical protein
MRRIQERDSYKEKVHTSPNQRISGLIPASTPACLKFEARISNIETNPKHESQKLETR